jgi:TATA-box binding protein (TBP) (component of TFIID and TFIIIB)
MKGKYCTTVYKKAKVKNVGKINTKLFYNQITIILNNNGNNVNIKLFGNGSLHITGCKTIDEGIEVTRKLYLKLQSMRNLTDTIVLTKDQNGVLIDKDKLVYSYKDFQIIGHVESNKNSKDQNEFTVNELAKGNVDNIKIDGNQIKYCINKKEYVIDYKTGMFVSNKMETQRRRFLYNFDGEYIGCSQIQLLKNRNKFYKKNINIYYDLENDLIYHNNNIIIGKILYEYDNTKVTNTNTESDILEISYKCNPFLDKNYTIESIDQQIDTNNKLSRCNFDLNVNCINVYFNIGYTINRQRFYEKLINLNYICKYKPESYSGIKLIYKKNELNKSNKSKENYGICQCTSKCTCINITFLIFQSGNVIATGFKTMEQVTGLTEHFNQLCCNIRDVIQKRSLF